MVKKMKNTKNVIYLNAGDYFEGSLYFILWSWNITQHFLNLLPPDVMVSYRLNNGYYLVNGKQSKCTFLCLQTLGNYEFDIGIIALKVVYDRLRKPFKRITDLQVVCQSCIVPIYIPIENFNIYKLIISDFAANGGDGLDLIPKYIQNKIITDIDALVKYVLKKFLLLIYHK